MKKSPVLAFALICFFISVANAQDEAPDTVKTGIYVTSIHDIDFKQNEYSINLWLWMRYKNKAFNFLQNLEIPQAKTFTQSYSTIDTSNGQVYLLMKLQCIMKDTWRIKNFPFDKQRLRLSIENSQYDAGSLVFVADTSGKNYDTRFTLRGWRIDSFNISTGTKVYETNFGDESIGQPKVEYSAFRSRIVISRDASDLFWKLFLGMYVSFLIAYMCFYIHADNIDSRFALSVGSLFAAIGNKYIIDSSLPESTTFTLVDTLHGLTLFFIFVVIAYSAFSLILVKKNKLEKANRMDFILAQIVLVIYVGLNLYFISQAKNG